MSRMDFTSVRFSVSLAKALVSSAYMSSLAGGRPAMEIPDRVFLSLMLRGSMLKSYSRQERGSPCQTPRLRENHLLYPLLILTLEQGQCKMSEINISSLGGRPILAIVSLRRDWSTQSYALDWSRLIRYPFRPVLLVR
jgi:hypothetical protein